MINTLRRRTMLSLAAVSVAVGLAGCGSSTKPTTTTAATTTATGSTTTTAALPAYG